MSFPFKHTGPPAAWPDQYHRELAAGGRGAVRPVSAQVALNRHLTDRYRQLIRQELRDDLRKSLRTAVLLSLPFVVVLVVLLLWARS